MQEKDIIDYSDKSLFEDNDHMPLPGEKEFYTPEETYELVMSDVQSIYFKRWEGYYMANTDKWYYAYTIEDDTITVVDACHAQNMHD